MEKKRRARNLTSILITRFSRTAISQMIFFLSLPRPSFTHFYYILILHATQNMKLCHRLAKNEVIWVVPSHTRQARNFHLRSDKRHITLSHTAQHQQQQQHTLLAARSEWINNRPFSRRFIQNHRAYNCMGSILMFARAVPQGYLHRPLYPRPLDIRCLLDSNVCPSDRQEIDRQNATPNGYEDVYDTQHNNILM